MLTSVNRQIDLELSVEQHRTVFKRGIDHELDCIKEVYDGMDNLLNKAATSIASEMMDDLDLNVIYFPQIGFLVTVPSNAADALVQSGRIDNSQWERMFSSNERAYFKDKKTLEMDAAFGDIYATICGMIPLRACIGYF